MKITTKLILAAALLALLLVAEAWLNYRHATIVRETATRFREIFAPVLSSSRGLTLDLANLHTALAEPDAWVRERAGAIVIEEFQTRLERTRYLLESATHQPLEPRFAATVQGLLRDTLRVEHALADFSQAWGAYVLLSVSDPTGAAEHAQKALRPILNEEVGPALTRLATATNRQIEADVTMLETDTTRDTRLRLYFTFGFFSIVSLLSWSLHRSAIAPLRHLAAAAGSVTRGNRTIRLDYSKADELGTVALAFNDMLDTLHATTVSRAELETVVATRTAELRESQAHLARAMEGSQHGYWDWDLASNRLDFSPRWATMLGYAADELEPRFSTWENLVHPDDKLPTMRALLDHAEGRHPDCEIEHRLRTKAGAWRWMLARGRIVSRDPDGRAHHLSGTQTDIHDRKTIEASLSRLSFVAQRTHNAVVLTNPAGEIEWINEGFTRITGYTFDEVRGRKPGSFLQGPDTEPASVAAIRAALDHQTGFDVEITNYGKTGRRYRLAIEARPLRDAAGRLTGFMAIETDITARHEAERALRASREQLNLALTVSATALWDADLLAGTIYLDEHWAAILGRPLAPATVRLRDLVALLPPDERGMVMHHRSAVLAGHLPEYNLEHRVRHADGTWRWVLSRGRIVERAPDGRPLRMIGTNTDITDRKQAEAATRRQKEFLDALHRTTLDLLEQPDMDTLLQSIIERSTAILDAPLGQLLLAEGDHLVIRSYTLNHTALLDRRIARGRALLSWQAFDTHEPVVVSDYETFAGPRESYRPGPVRAVAEFPILRGDACLGVLALARSDSQSPFTPEEIERGRMLARQAALVVHHASIYADAVRRAEAGVAALRESEEKFRGVFDQSPVIIGLLSVPEGRVVELNAAGLAAFGCARDEIINHTSGELGIWADPDERARYLAAILQRGHVSGFEARMRRKNGEVFTVLYSGSLLSIGGQRYSLNSLQDISDRKRAEEALQLAQTRLIAAQRIARLGSWEWNAQTDHTVWSEENFRIFGVEPAAFTPSFRNFLQLIAPADRARMEQTLTRALTRRESYRADYEIIRPDGLHRHLHDEAEPIFATDGALLGFRGTSQDVTAQVHAASERQQMEAQLRQAQKLESLGTLAGGIAHDFNNILTGMLGFVELVRLDLPRDHPARQWIEGISASGGRAKDLVRQILTFSRRDESTQLPTKLAAVVAEAVQLLRSTLPPMVRLETAIEADCPPVLADSTQLHQVLMNLCTNAWHALPAAGGSITVSLASLPSLPPAQAAKPDARPGPHLHLTVRDNGSGMDAATLDRIFEPFFTTKPTGQGTGLGLAVTHGIVQSHGGQIDVHSTPGVGTSFEIFLPALLAPAKPAPEPALTTLPRGDGQHLLYVDDDTVGASALTQLFHRLGYRVTCETDARAALDRYADNPAAFDLVLTDYAMPGMTGLELAETLLQRDPSLPVILLSGLIEPRQREHLLALGVKAVLLKPPALRELAEAVAQVFATRPPAAK